MKPIQIKKILVPLDFSVTSLLAFEHAVNLAKTFKAELYLLHVIEKTFFTHDVFLPETKIVNLDNISKIAENKMMELSSGISPEEGVKTEVIVAAGKVAKEIIRTAKDTGTDVIVMGTHGASGFEEFFIGSNAERVVVRANCPVLTIQSYARVPGFKKIIFPVDNSVTSRQKLAHAIFIAKNYNSKIYVLGLLSDDDKEHAKTFEFKIQQVNEYLEKNKIEHESSILHQDDHAKATMRYAEEKDADLIVIMSEQELDSAFFMGVAAQTIVNHSKVPVLTVSPEGFEVGGSKNNPF